MSWSPGFAIDHSERLREDAVPSRSVVDAGHSRNVSIHRPECDEHGKNRNKGTTVGAKRARHHRGEGSHTSPDGVCPRAHGHEGHGEIEAADQEDANDDAAMEVALRIFEFFG